MRDTIRITPGQLTDSLALRNESALSLCTEIDSDDEGVFFRAKWPTLSSGERLLWRVLDWLNGGRDLPSESDLRSGLDTANLAAVWGVAPR